MPTRLLREGILSSERIDQLDWPAEVFYRRLMSKVDDHGLYDARPSMLRASLYPLRVDRVREADISRWIAACEKAGLIALYSAGGKPYLKMLDTNWQTRSEPKYPLPTENDCKQVETPVTVVEVGVVSEGGRKTLSGKPDVTRREAKEILNFLNAKTGRRYEPVEANIKPIMARLKEGSTADEVKAVIERKCVQWLADEKMAQYLRPDTLFNATKFANYKGELTVELPAPKVNGKPWFIASSTAIEEKGREKGITQLDDESFPTFKARVFRAWEITPDQVRQAEADYR